MGIIPKTEQSKTASKILSREFWASDKMIITYIALANLILRLVAIKGYGYFRDELYYIACSNHLDFGYVDQPPLSILILKGVRLLFGDPLIALRMLPVLGGALFVWLTGWMVKELGGRKFAVILAATAAFGAIGNGFLFNYYSMNFLDLLFWQILILIMIRILKTGNPKYWLLFGIMAGLGLQNKISILFLCFGLMIGLILTKERKQFQSKYLWIGAGIALLIFLPYVIWNWTHGWVTLEFMHNARAYKMAAVTPLGFFMSQLLYNNPANLIIWLAGIGFFLFSRQGKPYRLFGWMFLTIYFLFTIQQAKGYYLAGGYPILFAGGAVVLETWLKYKRLLVLRIWITASIIISALIFYPYAIPILPVPAAIEHIARVGIEPQPGENHEMGILPQHFADMHGWEAMAKTFGDVFEMLTPEEKKDCMIYVRNYGEAGAIDFFGERYRLPKATCTHNNYWLWGLPDWSGRSAIILGWSDNVEENIEDLSTHFEEVEYAATFTCQYCMPYENNRHIFICRRAKGAIKDLEVFWENEKHFN